MRPNDLLKTITARFNADIARAIYIKGSPGVGKTKIAEQAAAQLGVGFKVIHAPLMQPEDYGFPVISQCRKDIEFVVSKAKFPLVVGQNCPERGILLIDELPQDTPSGQKILANLTQAREIHGHKLLPGWMIIATGNRAIDRSGAGPLLAHLRARVTHVDLEVSLDDWTNWAMNNGVKMEVIAFCRFRPELLNSFDPHAEISPTPRAWAEGVSAQLGVVDPSLEFELFKGDIGEGAAAEFLSFLKIWRKLPNPDAILLNPKNHDVPSDLATLYALCGALAARTTPNNFGRVMEYVKRMPAEFGVLFVRDAMRKCPEIQITKEFTLWFANNGSKVLA